MANNNAKDLCNCISYNSPHDFQTDREVVLDPRNYGISQATKTVCVDACISEQIKAVWRAGIVTGGCCCGHNKLAPSLFVYFAKDVVKACDTLAQSDPNRSWNVCVWSHSA